MSDIPCHIWHTILEVKQKKERFAMGGFILMLIALFLFSLVGAILFWVIFGFCCLISFLFKGWIGGWVDRGQSDWFSKHGNVVVATVASALTVVVILLFFFQFMPWWKAEKDRNAPTKFIEEWGNGEKKARQPWEVWWSPWDGYDNRAESDRLLFEVYSPTNIISIKQTTNGVFFFKEPVQEDKNRLVKTKEYIIETSGYSILKTRPRTMTILLGVAVDTHKVCFVEDISPKQQNISNAKEPDRPIESDTLLQSSTTAERQIELLRQDVAQLAIFENTDDIDGIFSYLSQVSDDRLKDWKLASSLQNCKGQFILGMFLLCQSNEDKKTEGIEMLKKAATGGMREANYWIGLTCLGSRFKDYPEANRRFMAAADRGHVKSQYLLGIMYGSPRFGMQNSEESAVWFFRAVENGMPEAQPLLEEARRDVAKQAEARWKRNGSRLPPGFVEIKLGPNGKVKVGR